MEKVEGVSPSLLGPIQEPMEEVPAHFKDLLLGELEKEVFAAHPGMGLEAVFRNPLRERDGVLYRQQVARDLEGEGLSAAFRPYFRAMEGVRARLDLAAQDRHPWQARLYFLQAASAYLEGVEALAEGLARHPPRSEGLRAYRDYLESYRKGAGFLGLRRDLEALQAALRHLRYVLHVHEGRLALRAYGGEEDYGERVQATFRPFFGKSPPSFREEALPLGPWLNHVEEWILDHLALLFPEVFRRLEAFSREHRDFPDPTLARLEREARFFLAYLDFVAPLRAVGLPFAYPELAEAPPFLAEEAYDLVLAARLLAEGKRPVGNGFRFQEARILVVTGPNQGGKTTFARMVGQLHHLAALGLPVPARRARLSLPRAILTHFEARENPEELKSKLEEDLHRLKALLDRADGHSLLLLNEPLASAALLDARLIGRFLLERIRAKGSLAVLVTFLDELARLPGTLSLVAEVDPQDPSRRTFRILERPADGKAYALALAAKHGLTYPLLKERLGGRP